MTHGKKFPVDFLSMISFFRTNSYFKGNPVIKSSRGSMKLLVGFISLCLTVIAIVYIVHAPKAPRKAPERFGVLTVSASQSKSFSPTNIRYALRFEKRGTEKGTLIEANHAASSELVELVKTLGVPADSVTIRQFSLEKAWKWEDSKRIPDGFEISQNIAVNLPDPAKVPAFIEGVAAIRDVEITQSTPELSSAAERKNEVYRDAVKEATEKAKALAKASKGTLGKVLSIGDENFSTNSFGNATDYGEAAMLGGARKMSGTAVPAQKIEIGASVTMKFQLK